LASPRPARAPRRARLHLEELEPRLVPSYDPTAAEQLFLEELNDARANPAAYGASIGVDLSNVAPSQPLTFDTRLIQAARLHSQDMSDNAYFAHTTPAGVDPGARMSAAGFPWTSWGESIAAGYPTPADALKGLILDAGVPDLGHRRHLLAIDSIFQNQGQVGVGIVQNGAGPYVNYYTIDTAASSPSLPFLTGVVYSDTNGNGKYDMGEGLGGVTVTVVGANATTTFATGGYSVQLYPGTYTVVVQGGPFGGPVSRTVSVGSANVRADFNPGPSDATWIANVGQDLLQRPLTDGELAYWTGYLQAGGTRDGIVANFVNSAEYARLQASNLVNQFGQDLLQRPLQPNEINYWAAYLQGGGSQATVLTSMVSGVEYSRLQDVAWVAQLGQSFFKRTLRGDEDVYWVNYLQGGGFPSAVVLNFANAADGTQPAAVWVSQVGLALFQRPLQAGEINYWAGYLQTGGTRDMVVANFLSSAEYTRLQAVLWVGQLGQLLLQRPLQASELNFWAAYLQNGGPRASVVANFANSAEFSRVEAANWVNQLGASFLKRNLRGDELSYWVNYLQAGGARAVVAASFADSPEFPLTW
jgi:uncharacterized protein YkwD